MGKVNVDVQVGNSIYTVEADENDTDEQIRQSVLSQIGATPTAVQSRGIRPGAAPAEGDGYSGPVRDADMNWEPGKPIESGAGTRKEGDIGFYQDEQPWTKLPEDFNERYRDFAMKAAAAGNLTGDTIRAWAASAYPGLVISNADTIAEAFKKTNKLNTSGAIVQKPAAIKPEGDLAPITAFGRGAAKTAGAATLPALSAAYNIATGPQTLGDWRGELDRQLAVQAGYEQEHPVASFLGQMAGYAAPWARAGGARGAGLFGGLSGLSGGYFESGGDPGAALLQGLTEGAFGYGTEALGNRLAAAAKARFARPAETGPGQAAYEAAQARGVELPGTMTSPTIASMAERESLTAAPVMKAEQKAAKSTGERLNELADIYLEPGQVAPTGTPADIKVGMGESLVKGASGWLKGITDRAGVLYKDAERLSQNAVIPPHETRAVLAQEMQNLSQLPNLNANQISIVNDIFTDLANSPGGVQSLRDMRTALWNRLSASDVALTTSQKGALVSRISGALSRDVENGLTNLSKTTGDPRFAEALTKYQQANALWKERSSTVENVLAKVLGKDDPNEIIYAANNVWDTNVSPQNAAEVLQRFTRKDHGDLVRTMNLLDDTSKGDVRASLINMLGVDKSGAFDPASFLRNLDAVPAKTQEALFGADGMKALSQFRDIADVMVNPLAGRGSQSRLATAAKFLELLGIGAATLKGGVEGGFTGAGLAAAGTSTLAGGLNYTASRILASPKLGRLAYLLAKATNSENRTNVIQQIGKFVARNPDLREVAADLVQRATGTGSAVEGPLVGRSPRPEEEIPTEDVDAIVADAEAALGGNSGLGTALPAEEEQPQYVTMPDGTPVPAYTGAQ